MKKALITGITGQDGSFLADLLLEKGYEVHGLVRRSSRGWGALENVAHLVNNPDIYRKKLILHNGDLCDTSSLNRILQEVRPQELYNFGSQADVADSFFQPEYTHDATGTSVVRLLEAVKRFSPDTKFVQASTSELFGKVKTEPQNEETPLNPQSPYAVAKYVGYQSVRNYRDGYKLFASNSIAFNHASERRTSDYLDAKVTRAVARIYHKLQDNVRLGNLDSYRDWCYAPNIVRGMWLILQQDKPDDFVLGSGKKIQVRDWVRMCFEYVGLKMDDHVVFDPALMRPTEVDSLLADYSKAKRVLGWEPTVDVRGLIKIMMDSDLKKAKQEKLCSTNTQ